MLVRWGIPLAVVTVLLAAGVWVAVLPVKADHHDCGASSIAIVTGADVPEEFSHECHKTARTDMIVASLPTGAGIIAAVLSVVILRSARRTE